MKFNSLIPELLVADFKKSLDFYTNILGFKIEYDRPEKKFAMLSLGDSQLMINERNGTWETGNLEFPFGRGINLEIKTANHKQLIASLKKNNLKLYQEPQENRYRIKDQEIIQKEFLVQDPDGYLLRFTE